MGFCHLHLHTEYSLLDGGTQIKKLFKRIKELGMDSVAITEHGNMHALITKYKLAKDAGIKLIFGVEIYVVNDLSTRDKTQRRYHLVLLAKNLVGYRNLIALVSEAAATKNFYYKPRVDKEMLEKYSEGIVCLSACIANDIAQSIIHGREGKARELIKEYVDIFGKEDFYLEVQNHQIPEEKGVREAYYRLAEEFGVKVVATNDSHYLLKEDKRAHAVLLCIQTNSTITNPKRFRFQGDGYHVMSEQEIRELFPGREEVVDNTVEVASKCNVELDIGKPIFPEFTVPEGMMHEDYLIRLCSEALRHKYGGVANFQEAEDRMKFELSVINKMGYATYFLIVHDFIAHAKTKCQVGPGRGSGAGSIVAYLLGITQLEPLSLGLLFERFLNPDRISLPDFDIDFGDKDAVLDYVKNLYGAEKVALIGTFGTMSAKSVLKDVARVFGVPFMVSNDITKYVTEKTIQKSLEVDDGRGNLVNTELINYQKQYPEVFEIARVLEGGVRHRGIHACGVVWGKEPITKYLPVYSKGGMVVTQTDWTEVEAVGLLKFDFLGLETLNIIKKVLDAISEDAGWLERIPLDDAKVYEMLRRGDSIGIFQLESGGMQKTLKLVKPTCFDDIIAIVALYRPGSMGFIDVYARRKEGREEVTYPHPKAEEILKPTFGILVYQEQVMQLSRVLAGFTRGDSDVLRKAIGKKKIELMNKMEHQFKDGCVRESQMDPKIVNDLWDNIVKFASYSFNKSHAAAYALIAYRTAYLRYHYPVEFMCAVISSSVNDPDKMAFYIDTAKAMKIKVLPPEINFSQADFSIEKYMGAKSIRFGLAGVKNVGGEVLREIVEKRSYSSLQDFVNKVDLSKVNKRIMRSLISVGAFDGFKHNRAQMLEVCDGLKKADVGGGRQMTLFGNVAAEARYPDIPDLGLEKKLELEKQYLGIYVSGHPVDLYPVANSRRLTEFTNVHDERDVKVFGLVVKYNMINTRQGEQMAFMTIENRNKNKLEVVIFPNAYKDVLSGRRITEGMGVLVGGRAKEGSIVLSEIQFPVKVGE